MKHVDILIYVNFNFIIEKHVYEMIKKLINDCYIKIIIAINVQIIIVMNVFLKFGLILNIY